jgi:hypothetical protein
VDAHAEGQVLGRVRARDVEAIGLRELRRVAVRGREARSTVVTAEKLEIRKMPVFGSR